MFRRSKGKGVRSVDDVFNSKTRTWSPYAGDRLDPEVFGDRTTDLLHDD